jgi:hypothetical protein
LQQIANPDFYKLTRVRRDTPIIQSFAMRAKLSRKLEAHYLCARYPLCHTVFFLSVPKASAIPPHNGKTKMHTQKSAGHLQQMQTLTVHQSGRRK